MRYIDYECAGIQRFSPNRFARIHFDSRSMSRISTPVKDILTFPKDFGSIYSCSRTHWGICFGFGLGLEFENFVKRLEFENFVTCGCNFVRGLLFEWGIYSRIYVINNSKILFFCYEHITCKVWCYHPLQFPDVFFSLFLCPCMFTLPACCSPPGVQQHVLGFYVISLLFWCILIIKMIDIRYSIDLTSTFSFVCCIFR